MLAFLKLIIPEENMTAIILTCKKRRRNYELQLQPIIPKAEEFINHEEILETLSYAEKNKTTWN